jgi:N-acetylmuramoyl-L-alanine amidase
VRRIIIDPGHGGHHKGGVGIINGRQVYEKDLAIAVAEKLERHFQRDPRFEVRLTRREDVYVGLYERTVRASQLEGDLFISIHANAVEGKAAQQRARGFEIWTWNRTANRSAAAKAIERLENDDPGMTRENNRILTSMMMDALESQALISRRVAQAVHSRAIQHPYLKRHDRGIDSARFKVLEIYDMPSILMELGFMTHPEEVKMLFDPSFQDDWALIMYEGIIRYYEQSDPTFPRARPSMVAAR